MCSQLRYLLVNSTTIQQRMCHSTADATCVIPPTNTTTTTVEMDYSTLKTIKSQRDLADGIDLSVNYANEHVEQEKIYSKYLNNNRVGNNSCGSGGGGGGDSVMSVVDEDDNHQRQQAQPMMVSSTTISPNTTGATKIPQHDTKFKLNFSVDRILGNEPVTAPAPAPSPTAHNGCYPYTKPYSNCIDCPSSNQSMFSLPFSTMASMLSLNKAIVRPMPVRYLTRSPTVPSVHSTSVNLATAAQSYAKYHHHQLHSPNSPAAAAAVAANNGSGCSYKSHVARSPQRHPANITAIDSPVSSNANAKRKRSWSRAVFSQLQRKGLEIQFQIQKYITKPDRRKLAARLGLTDAQVKVWFQNRRMKWRHTRESKINQEKAGAGGSVDTTGSRDLDDIKHETSSSCGSDEDDIDVVAE